MTLIWIVLLNFGVLCICSEWNVSSSTSEFQRYENTYSFLRRQAHPLLHWYTQGRSCFKDGNTIVYEYNKASGMQKFNSDIFCTRLQRLGANKGLLLVGDSLQAHWVTQLAALFNASRCADVTDWNENDQRLCMCNDTQKIRFIRNDALDTSRMPDTMTCNMRENTFCSTWATPEIMLNFSVFIFNTGAHYRNNDLFIKELTHAIKFIKQYENTHKIVYRNSVPGHATCDDIGKPFVTTTEAEEWIVTRQSYNYDKFKRQNVLAQALFEKMLPKTMFLDAYASGVTRGDEHQGSGDCLHLCAPSGTMLQWSDALFRLFL
jgi:hypothetical protein